MKWAVILDGNNGDLKYLQSLEFHKLSIIKDSEQYYMISNDFDSCNNPDSVYCKAEKFVKVINGISPINLNLVDTIKINGITLYAENPNEPRKTFAQASIRGSIVVRTELNDEKLDCNQVESWVKLAFEDEDIEKVFRLISYGMNNFVNLYRIFELIEHSMRDKLYENLNVTKKEVNRFTGTANHPGVAGDLARHGYMKEEPVAKPMSLSEANSFVYKLVYKWIHYKLKQN